MIGRLTGHVLDIENDCISLDVNGVGYELTCTSGLLHRIDLGTKVTIVVYTDVREDAIRLFGFDSQAEKQVFLLLNRVSGMGPRSSLDVVSSVSIRDLLHAIGSGDINALMAIKGVGKKKAERIVVELRDLVANMAGERSSSLRSLVSVEKEGGRETSIAGDAIAALQVLGFPVKDAEAAVARATSSAAGANDVGELVREALRFV